jgi:hypothetical protein
VTPECGGIGSLRPENRKAMGCARHENWLPHRVIEAGLGTKGTGNSSINAKRGYKNYYGRILVIVKQCATERNLWKVGRSAAKKRDYEGSRGSPNIFSLKKICRMLR